MNDSIIELLNLKGDGLVVTDQKSEDNNIFIWAEKSQRLTVCPICSSSLYSKGSSLRKLNHPVLQDGRTVTIFLKKRKYKCSCCGYFVSDSFSIAQPGKHSTSVLPLLILKEFRSLNVTAADLAERLSVSDTTVHNIFMDSIRMERLPLSEVISIDEVFLNTDYKHKYAMVILDFLTGEPIDIIRSRRDEDTSPYFRSIPLDERNRVRYLICDMYNPYISFTRRYFHNAKAVVDCFHVIKWLNDSLRIYYNQVKKRYIQLNKERLGIKNTLTNREYETIKDSKELYILKRYRYFLFSDKDHIDYSRPPLKDFFLDQHLDQYQKERLFFKLDDKFETYRDLKEKYLEFDKNARVSDNIPSLFDELINDYSSSGEKLFNDFAEILIRHREYILNSYTYYEVTTKDGSSEKRRLSNGPIESFNTKPKTLKRISHGVNNFDYFRQRLLWACRKNISFRIPDKEEIRYHPKGKKRGKYRKNK